MPRHEMVYDKKLKAEPDFERLYHKWVALKNADQLSSEWEHFESFYFWAKKNGYEICARLFRRDLSKQYSPENCYFVVNEKREYCPMGAEWISLWNKTVNRIRKYCGMELLPGTEEKDDEQSQDDRPV